MGLGGKGAGFLVITEKGPAPARNQTWNTLRSRAGSYLLQLSALVNIKNLNQVEFASRSPCTLIVSLLRTVGVHYSGFGLYRSFRV